ncbi:gliding motility-associated C-terminal domain-containing protein [Pedobacter cryoconitis]|uniref:gliding motility-associated C-terminal domain-containing protein n=1 Tax=Pedobacter cryoconitis TaxID=188932 RepID=UPI00160760D4|nr:gliding motility-associated C-terminal domain-containing protein [Pedobacter cryoconitis]MBB5646373.1 gliding motility-associated-like protein [Pedobacter cryoconitis]
MYSSIALPEKSFSQICTGSFGDPVVNIDFGRGTSNFGPSLGASTNYQYVSSFNPGDGSYTIVKKIGGGAWFETVNHTPNDPDGYMMMINASYQPGVFYETAITTDLCPNTTYEFAAWVTNLLTYSGNKPNLTFSILTLDDQLLGTYKTGDIPESPVSAWKQYGFLFRTSNSTKVKIRIANNGPGGDGNDLALDDITFRACGPKITPLTDNVSQTEKTICEGNGVVLSATVEGSPTLQYQWQKMVGGQWADLNGENAIQLNLTAGSLPAGDFQYRLMAAEATNFSSPACRTTSQPITIRVKPLPKPVVVAEQTVCEGNTIQLDVTGADGPYAWTGPNNFSSTEKSPVIANAALDRAGDYQVTTTLGTCTASAKIKVNMLPVPIPVVETPAPICGGASVVLHATGGIQYKWAPATGLSATDVADPVASPAQTTLYTVTVSNGGCEKQASVNVEVYQKITVSAGRNRVIIEGQTVTLEGQVSGDHFKYLWSPADFLDDPAKLNPVATPVHDVTYTLTAWSENGCPGDAQQVAIHVLKKLVIPNTITPNGDGINDIWTIAALDTYPAATVYVFNRYGGKVYSGKGDGKGWDGKYNGEYLPVGVYYYVIDLHDGQKIRSGSLTVLR